jgi:CheY-like chemotaxis protein
VNGELILLVEDSADDELLTIRALRKNNILNEVVIARDGAQALELLLGNSSVQGGADGLSPHFVLLDLKLPKMSGLEVLRKLRENEKTRLLPVVVFSSSDERQDILESYNLGANSYICKPVDFTEFIEAVGQMGSYWLVLNEAPPIIRDS